VRGRRGFGCEGHRRGDGSEVPDFEAEFGGISEVGMLRFDVDVDDLVFVLGGFVCGADVSGNESSFEGCE